MKDELQVQRKFFKLKGQVKENVKKKFIYFKTSKKAPQPKLFK